MSDLFEKASRAKLRYDTTRGQLAVDDLWDLPLAALNRVAVALHDQLKNESVSYLDDAPKANETLQLKFDVAKYVIDVRKTEIKERLDAQTKTETKQKIMGIIARRKDAALEEKPIEELESLLQSL